MIYTLVHTNILKLEISSYNITLVIFNIRTNPMHEKTSYHVMVTEKTFLQKFTN